MLSAQGNACAICAMPFTRVNEELWKKHPFVPHVDHDHRSGWVRGLLCRRCNLGLGLFDDSVSSLRRAADYLEDHETEDVVPRRYAASRVATEDRDRQQARQLLHACQDVVDGGPTEGQKMLAMVAVEAAASGGMETPPEIEEYLKKMGIVGDE